jgi:D-sedoheptulose 7-phosphate isomerase
MTLLEYLKDYTDLFQLLDNYEIQKLISYLKGFDKNQKIYVIGNGGSLALAEHFAQDLLKKCYLPAVALTNMSNLTAISNDFDYIYSYLVQLETYAHPKDCLICFTSSGESKNIIKACEHARLTNMRLVSFTGFNGGDVKEMSHINIHVPCFDYGIVESIHSILFHFIIDSLYNIK